MLLELKGPPTRLTAFEPTMKKEPNRFRGFYGAAQAAEAAGDAAKARSYYSKLVEACASADMPLRPELAAARTKR